MGKVSSGPAPANHDPHAIYQLAKSFQEASRELIGVIASRAGATSGKIPFKDIHVLAPTITLASFSLELFLKCLATLETGATPRGHNIRDLFDKLRLPLRERIEPVYNYLVAKEGDPRFDHRLADVLDTSADAFEYFRYVYEKMPADGKGFEASIVAEAVQWLILERQPSWEPDATTFPPP